MDVMTKVSLMHVYESYWELLPDEIKEVILKYRERQELIDWRESEVSRALGVQIRAHGRLRAIWPGHIQCRPMRFDGAHVRTEHGCSFGPTCEHMRIYGHYYSHEVGDGSRAVRRRYFIAFGFERAVENVCSPFGVNYTLPGIIARRASIQ